MGYVEKCILKDEKLIHQANLSNCIYFNELFWFLLLAIYHLFNTKVINISNEMSFKMLSPILITWVVFFIKEVIRDKSTCLAITNERIIGKKGLIAFKSLDTHLTNIDNVQINMTIMGRIFKYGTVVIESRSDTYIYKSIANPNKMKDIINEQIIRRKNETKSNSN